MLFYRLAKLSDTLRTAKLPSELLTQKQRVIKVRIGNAIPVKDQNEHQTIDLLTEFLRKKTYVLANPFAKKKLIDSLPKTIKLPKSPKKIAGAAPVEAIVKEIEALRQSDCRLLESKNYEVFLAPANVIPNVLQEIGRLREITFREVGEGTNNATDLDQFDLHYHHLFLWDREQQKIAGAYRMGLGQDIYKSFGIDGFYLWSGKRSVVCTIPFQSKNNGIGLCW